MECYYRRCLCGIKRTIIIIVIRRNSNSFSGGSNSVIIMITITIIIVIIIIIIIIIIIKSSNYGFNERIYANIVNLQNISKVKQTNACNQTGIIYM